MPNEQEKHPGFDEVVKPVIKWLAENCNPHTKIIIENNFAELVSGEKIFSTLEFLKD